MTTAILELNHARVRCPACLLYLFGQYTRGRLLAVFSSWTEAGWEVDHA